MNQDFENRYIFPILHGTLCEIYLEPIANKNRTRADFIKQIIDNQILKKNFLDSDCFEIFNQFGLDLGKSSSFIQQAKQELSKFVFDTYRQIQFVTYFLRFSFSKRIVFMSDRYPEIEDSNAESILSIKTLEDGKKEAECLRKGYADSFLDPPELEIVLYISSTFGPPTQNYPLVQSLATNSNLQIGLIEIGFRKI